ncbi:uncharacterized protein [Venturia canescens]|uniref:uncharacterized protein n=1 Tax=Venturia canescens TaxID=32260 RepID=UPI001C9C4120|nr:uncharacterized protein LOC122413489 [Venturia canescens]
MILAVYETQKFLTPSARNRLVRFVIKQEQDHAFKDLYQGERLNEFVIPAEKFSSWANEIVATFPGERFEVYFTPFKTVNGQQINASGKLWHHYNYTKGVMKKNSVLRKRCEPINIPPIAQDTIDKANILRTKVDPWYETIQLWNETYDFRIKYLMNERPTVSQYLESFACLRMQKAIDLYESDFVRQYPQKSSLLKDNWGKTRSYLIKRLQNLKISNVEEKGYIHLLPTLSSDGQNTILLYLLPHLIAPGRFLRKRKTLATRAIFMNLQTLKTK